MTSKILILCLILFFISVSSFAQEVTLDWKIMDIGQVRQFIANNGSFWNLQTYDYTGLLTCEFPPNSYEEHVGEVALWVGAITPDGDTLVTVGSSWNPWGRGEFWPGSSETWDTVWVVSRNDTVDIPYWENYVGKADRDYVFRYNDYNIISLMDDTHSPLYLDVIEIAHTWSAPDVLAQVIMYEFYIIPKEFDLKKMYITEWIDPNVGLRSVNFYDMLGDDYSIYYHNLKMGVGVDDPGGSDGESISPIGIKIFPPKNVAASQLKWTFKWGGRANPPGICPTTDGDKYRELMMANQIMENQQSATGSHFVISFGPFELAKNDTFHFQMGQVLGYGLDAVLENAEVIERLEKRDFKVPAPPPEPPLQAITDNHQVKLMWTPSENQNPETYFDPNRADGDTLPFEGYRVYKSTQSLDGPWKLLAEYDVLNDEYGNNIGIQHEYIDDGLLNNIEYYYSVTAYSKEDNELNWPSLETSIRSNAITVVPGTAPPENVGKVAVVPNPYRGDINYNAYDPPWERTPPSRNYWMEQDRRIQFINLPSYCEIKIYTLRGTLVATLLHQEIGTNKGYHDWNLTSSVGQAIASGIYLFTVEDKQNGDVQVSKFVIIK